MTLLFDPHQVPREVPGTVKAVLFFDRVLYIALGTLAFGMGLFFLIGMSSLNTFRVFFFDGPFSITAGEIVYVEGTKFRIGRARLSSVNEIFEYGYRYNVDGQILKGVAYNRGVAANVKVGTPLKIEYRIEKPHWSRLASWATVKKPDWARFDHWSDVEKPNAARHFDLRMNVAPIELLAAPAFFALVGGIFLFVGLRSGLANIVLVTNGIVAWGKATDETSVNTQNAFYRSYKFKTPHGVEITARVRKRRDSRLKNSEQLVYDYRRPENAVSFQALSTSVQKALLKTGQVESPTVESESFGKPSPPDEIDEINEIQKLVK